MANREVVTRPMSQAERDREIRKMQMAIKYDMFTTFGESSGVDSEIVDLPADKFNLFTRQFSNGIEFLEALTSAEEYVQKGTDVPPDLWGRIVQIRKDYISFKRNANQ